MKVCRVQDMRDADATAISRYGITQEILMENAGQAAFEVVRNYVRTTGASRILIFCGLGNNGGDGLVVARKLFSIGVQVQIYLLGDGAKFKGAAALNYRIVKKLGLPLEVLQQAADCQTQLAHCDAVIDAIFGTGLARDVQGKFAETIEAINRSGKRVFSLDIPSGINGDNGQIMHTAIRANSTITFGLPKTGNLLYPGYEYGGQLYVTYISFPTELHSAAALKIEINTPPALPNRPADAHKGSTGKALFIAGASQYLGAPFFSSYSFLKAGGGLSYLATPKTVSGQVATRGSEIVFLPVEQTSAGSISGKALNRLLENTTKMDFVVLGPGLSTEPETAQLVRDLVIKTDTPLLIDGDGITAISSAPEILSARKAPTVLTPHPGEMARLCNCTIAEIEADRIRIAQKTAQELQVHIILKGAHSLVASPGGNVFINLSGNAGMATAGSGDVLTGTIAAMSGLGLDFERALRAGVFLHGLAGDIAAADIGPDGMVAGDILNKLPQAIHSYRTDLQAVWMNHYGKVILL